MALERVVELGEGIRIGLNDDGEYVVVQVMWNDEVIEEFGPTDSVMPPCCVECVEDAAWVELDGRCPHGRESYFLKAMIGV